MYFVYVLKSIRNGKRYVGYTHKSPIDRLREHNTGSNKFTRQNGPFVLIYSEPIENKTVALKREKFLKSGQGRAWLDSIEYCYCFWALSSSGRAPHLQ
jgi:putative endonuclease